MFFPASQVHRLVTGITKQSAAAFRKLRNLGSRQAKADVFNKSEITNIQTPSYDEEPEPTLVCNPLFSARGDETAVTTVTNKGRIRIR